MKNVLQMAYHPAKKEVRFKRFQNGKEIEIGERSKLPFYMAQRGKFVLQHYGELFFDDVAHDFNGQKTIEMRVITTKPDFLDFEQMVEHYNKNNKNRIQIHATPGIAFSNANGFLPDMNQVYENVRDYGLKAAEILNELRSTFSDIPQDKEAIRESIANFDGDVQREIERIKEKVNSLGDNNVNLCFAGVYSTGKSALINALLGYRILPESSDSKTARMFQIRSPKDAERTVSITFKIGMDTVCVAWIEDKFEITREPEASAFCTGIRTQIEKFNEGECRLARHEQMCKLLEKLNGDDDVGTEIDIAFPIPLDTSNVQFTIFDTPGTDSNYEAHQQTLIEALDEQSNSILIFVASPDKLEGTGNRVLFEFINKTKEDGSSTIDISRSLFVINKADTVGPDDRKSKQTAQISSQRKKQAGKDEEDDVADEDVNEVIHLSDKKLLFVSAQNAYAAKAQKNNIATKDDRRNFSQAVNGLCDPEFIEDNEYYKQNKCAHSEFATNHMIAQCDAAMEDATAENDQYAMVHISSGLYALEKEIVQYGEKYAAAVRAYAMIDGVDKALISLQAEASSLKIENEEALCRINQEIGQLKDEIMRSINAVIDRYALPKGIVPDDQIKRLKVDNTAYTEVEKKIIKAIKRRLSPLLLRDDEKKKQLIKKDIDRILNEWTSKYLSERDAILTQTRDNAIADARNAIEKNGKLNPNAVQYVCNIHPPKLEARSVSIARLYDMSQEPRNILWMHTKYMDTKKFVNAVKEELKVYRVTQGANYRNDYMNSLSEILRAVQQEFEKNLGKYSLIIRAKMENRQSVEALHKQILVAAEKIENLRENLNNVIWEVQTDG